MSNWTTIISENGNYDIPLVNLSHEDYMLWEAKQEQMQIEKEGSGRIHEETKRKNAKWEARQKEKRAKWIDEYNKEFPRLSDVPPEHPDEYKINFIRERNKTRYEEYKARELERSSEKRERYEHLERIHAEECERILGPKWYSYLMLIDGEFDCELAYIMRYEDDLDEQHSEYTFERKHEERWLEFLEFNANKPPNMVWNATKMNELLK